MAAKSLNDAWLPAEDIPDELEIRWMPCPDDGEDSAISRSRTAATVFWGGEASAATKKQQAFVELSFNYAPPKAWAIFIEDEAEPFFAEASWVSANRAASIRLQWDRERPPSGLSVSWKGSGGSAWWPVNVLTAAFSAAGGAERPAPRSVNRDSYNIGETAPPGPRRVAAQAKRKRVTRRRHIARSTQARGHFLIPAATDA